MKNLYRYNKKGGFKPPFYLIPILRPFNSNISIVANNYNLKTKGHPH